MTKLCHQWKIKMRTRKTKLRLIIVTCEAIYEQVKAQSIQLSKLTDMVESLQSQVKQLQETTSLRKRKTTSIRKKSTSNKGINTRKKTKRIGSTRSRKK